AQYRQTRHNIELFTHNRFQGQSTHGFSGEHGNLVPIHETAVRHHAKHDQQQPSPTHAAPFTIQRSPFTTHHSQRAYGSQPSEQRIQTQAQAIYSVW
ncbi:MAG: hypothetical protein KDE31_28590, partial [Caldilineaceae bacterium]|nr:hypothetical protein [Caldilineaceae bacterium]